MKLTPSERIMRVMKVKRVPTAVITVLGLMFIILSYYVVGVIYYYSDYLVIFLPDSALPVMMWRSKVEVGKPTRGNLPGGNSPDNIQQTKNLSRVLCLIVTSPKYHDERASHVAVTWARHCTEAIFLTTHRDVRLPKTILTPGEASYKQLWGKVKQGFEWAYNHREKYDWFFKADDDTFAIIENLQAALASLDPGQALATGNHLKTWDRGSTYLNGGAGYVLSRGAVTKLVEEGLRTRACDNNLDLGTHEDVNMADCLHYLGVEFLDSRDDLKRQRFNVYPPQELIDPREAKRITHLWLKKVSVFDYKFGYAEMSDEVITFHYVNAQTMYLLYYLIYIVNPINSERIEFQRMNQKEDG